MECEVIRDLLPLYAEKMASGQSAVLVEKHLQMCESCRAEYEKMTADIGNLQEEDLVKAPLEQVKKKICRRKRIVAGFAAVLVYTVLMIAYAYVTEPIYLSGEQVNIQVFMEDGIQKVRLNGDVADYTATVSTEADGRNVVIIQAWTTRWHEARKGNAAATRMLEFEQEADLIGYADAEADGRVVWVYGESPSGTTMVLPRLALGMYAWLMAGIGIFLLVLFLINRRKNGEKSFFMRGSFR